MTGHPSSVFRPQSFTALIDEDRVLRVVLIPLGNQFVAGFADVLAVEDRAGEHARDIEIV